MNDTIPMTRLPLARFKVIDVSRVRSGPTAVRQLADWGADVIKVESPHGDGGLGGARHDPDFQNLHRNKRSITLDLKNQEGLKIFERLVSGADVLVENFRPDVKYRLRIDYERMRQINRRLIYASISGFGEDGPYRDRPGFDQIAQGMGGLMAITGLPGQGPVRAGTAIADLSAGILCAMGILISLLEREESGEGQWVKTNLLAAQIAMLDFQAARWLLGKERPRQAGNNHPTSIPTGVFRTEDGHINIAASGQAIYKRLCQALSAPHLADDPKFATERARSDNRDTLNSEIENITSRRKSAALIETLNNAGVPCGPIYQIDEMFDDPQVRHLEMVQPINHPKWGQIDLVGQAVTLNRTPSRMRLPTPECGEHTDAILTELGYDKTTVVALRRGGVI